MDGALTALDPAARIAAATLFDSVWEAAILAAAVWTILRVLPNLNATTRYAAWCVALAASVMLPPATAIPLISVQQNSVRPTSARVAISAAPHAVAANPIRGAKPAARAVSAAAPMQTAKRVRLSLPEAAALAVSGAWALAALLLLLRLAVNLWKLERLKSDALPLPLEYRERLSQWGKAEKGERDVRLCVCANIEVPVAVGLFDSMILIPRHLLQTLSPDEVDQIMLHELGHLRRADDWTNGLQRVLQALFFFNPAIAYIAQQLDLEREVACDDWVLRQTKSVRPYASCLTKMAEVTSWPHRPLAAPGVFVTRRSLSLRVERLLRAGRNIRTTLSFGPAGVIVVTLAVVFFALQSVAPTFAFTPSPPPNPQVMALRATAQPTATRASRSAAPRKSAAVTAYRTPAPRETTLVVPAVHVHVPAQNIQIHTPAVNVDVPEQRIHIAQPRVPPVLRSDPNAYFPSNLSKQIDDRISSAMKGAFDGNGFGGDFSGRNLAGRSFRGRRMTGADFSHADLQRSDFSEAVLVGVDFSGADLRGARFDNARMTGCDLSDAILSGTSFQGVSMTGCDINARYLSPQQARAVLAGCSSGCDLSHADLQGQDLRGLHVAATDLSRSDLRGADLSGSSFTAVDFSGARFTAARVDGTTFENCGLDENAAADLRSRGARVVDAGYRR